jgi:hypothetical protein
MKAMRLTLALLATAIVLMSMRADSGEPVRLDQEFKLRLQPDPVRHGGKRPPKLVNPVVKKIKVQYAGPITSAIENAVTEMETRVGYPYDVNSIEKDIRNLSATRNVTNVRMFGEPAPDGVCVIVLIQTKSTTAP